MKKKILLLPILMALAVTGCGKTNSSESPLNSQETPVSAEPISNSSIIDSSSEKNSKSSKSVPPPVILGDDFEEALKKDYTNMTVSFALNSDYLGEEWGYEYYFGDNDFVAVFDGSAAEGMGSTEYAWMYYSMYQGDSYAYWDRGYETEGWIAFGTHGLKVGIESAYFYMPYFLSTLTKDSVDYVVGTYVVKEDKVDEVLQGLKFTMHGNDITYIDMFLNDEGYISKIRGFDDPNEPDYGFQIVLGNFGVTTAPAGAVIPPAISPSTIKTYAEMIGHEEEPDVYITNLNIVINDTVESDSTYDIIAYPDDAIDVSYTYLPTNANKRDVDWVSTNENVVKVLYSPVSGHRYLRAIAEGETEIYMTHVNEEKQIIKSQTIKMKVNPAKEVPLSDDDVYRFILNGSEGSEGSYRIGATNLISGSEAPFSITSWRMDVRSTNNSDIFADGENVLYSACNSQSHFGTRFEDEVIFDFENQQVSQISFAYALYRTNALANLNKLESVVIATSNEGAAWTDINVTNEVLAELRKATQSEGMSQKIMTKTFEPANLVKITLKANSVGGNDLGIGLKDFVFSKNANCHNYNDVEPNPVTSITITAPSNRLKIGNSMKFSATVAPENATNKSVRWVSTNPDVISIDSRTGLATALAEGSAKIKAVSATNREMVSNEIEIETFLQDTIYDPHGYLTGKTFYATGITYGNDTFDVSFNVTSGTTAKLTRIFTIMGRQVMMDDIVTFDMFEPISKVYTFSTENGDILRLTVAEDGSSVSIQFRTSDGTYVIGSETSSVVLEKVR